MHETVVKMASDARKRIARAIICSIGVRSVWKKKKTGLYTHHLTVINIIVILSVIIITNIIIIITASHPSRTCMIHVTRYIYGRPGRIPNADGCLHSRLGQDVVSTHKRAVGGLYGC